MSADILIVDDQMAILQSLAIALRREGYRVVAATSGAEAVRKMEQTVFDLVVTDLQMPGLSGSEIRQDAGLELLKEVKHRAPDTEVIVLTGYASIQSAIEAMQLGAFDYVEKEGRGIASKLLIKVKQALERRKERLSYKMLRDRLSQWDAAQMLVGQSRVMEDIRMRIHQIAATNATVLITGETGTGKELVAQAIHRFSPRADKPLVTINCSALPADLFESELFGHVKGAFTDAANARRGLFEEANGGSFFMDEIGDLPEPLQAKLLRVLEERAIRRMGDNTPIPVDVRIIAATNQDLPRLVELGKFRRDLYYRLNVSAIHLPPLRERREDIPLLAHHFLTKLAKEREIAVAGFTPEALHALEQYDYPGNVRELRNVIENVLLVATPGARIDVGDLAAAFTKARADSPWTATALSSPEPSVPAVETTPATDTHTPIAPLPPTPTPLSQPHSPSSAFLLPSSSINLAKAEEVLIRQAVAQHRGNLNEAARQLGISRTTLWRRMKQYKIDRNGGTT
ncbi:MAG: sigma-54 dependent transcriptional regulator [Abditibacteriales bacterium]|nr:sigma-54 dependent transcriptional regulator [Abditibacteriales bacterium]MDW8365057.1 sigma-54 dependent transcriptional regulator [Abditibacteriales bacterium]